MIRQELILSLLTFLVELVLHTSQTRHLMILLLSVLAFRCAAILGVHLVKLFLLCCLPWMGLRFMGLDTGLTFWQVQLLTSLTLFVSNALPNVAGMGSVETAFLLVYSSFLPDEMCIRDRACAGKRPRSCRGRSAYPARRGRLSSSCRAPPVSYTHLT